MHYLVDLLKQSNYRTINIAVARKLGSVNAALFLGDLLDCYIDHEQKGELIEIKGEEGLWFYYMLDKCEERTTLSRYEQDSSIKILDGLGIIDKKLSGLPAKRYFRLNLDKLDIFISGQKNSTSLRVSSKEESGKTTTGFALDLQTSHITKEPNKDDDDDDGGGGGTAIDSSKEISFVTPKGERKIISHSEVYRALLKDNIPTDLIQKAISRAIQSTAPITDAIEFIRTTATNLFTQRLNKQKLANKNQPIHNLPSDEELKKLEEKKRRQREEYEYVKKFGRGIQGC